VTLGSARLGRRNEVSTDDIEQGSVEAMMVLAVAREITSGLVIELLSSPLQGNPQGRHPTCWADCHIKFRSCTQANAPRFPCAPFQEFSKIISIFKVVLRCLKLTSVACHRS